MLSLQLPPTFTGTFNFLKRTLHSVCFHVFTADTPYLTLVGTGYMELGTLFLVFTLNELIFSCNVAVLAVNLTMWTLSLHMAGQILSLQLLPTFTGTFNFLKRTFLPVCFHVFTTDTPYLTLVGTGYTELRTLFLVFTLNKLMFSCNVALLTINLTTWTPQLDVICQMSPL